ncbi:hypothetical protein MKW98_021742, partial [Papaver atlanticum]
MRHRGKMIMLPCIFISVFLACLRLGSAAVVGTSITQTQFITNPESIVSSKNGIFRLSFFSLGNSSNHYVGIWYNNIPGPTVVWVANRDHPLIFKIASDGNLVVLDGQGKLCWTTNVTTGIVIDHLVAELIDTGNLVLRESSPNYNYNQGKYFWQSFDHPTNMFLPGIQIGGNLRTGEKKTITSWKNDSNDPSTGDFTLELDAYGFPQLIVRNGSQRKWRSGPWVNFGSTRLEKFLGMEYSSADFKLQRDYSKGKQWNEEMKEWHIKWSSDNYNKCGPFGIYNQYSSQSCSCMRGFEPKSKNEWKGGNWSGGCVRRKELQCALQSNITGDQNSERRMIKVTDGFLRVETLNVPDYFLLSQSINSSEQCADKCLHSCSCIGYLHRDYRPYIGCMWWTGDLVDTTQETYKPFGLSGFNLHIRVANSELGNMKRGMRRSVEWERKRRYRKKKKKNTRRSFVYSDDDYSHATEPSDSEMLIGENTELRLIDFKTLAVATNNFSEANKLGQGGFGAVYK